jgi:hypothetical protein
LDENGQPLIQVESQEIVAVTDEVVAEEVIAEVTPESEEKSEEKNNN